MNVLCLRFFYIVLAFLPALSTQKFAAIDIAVNAISLVAMYILVAELAWRRFLQVWAALMGGFYVQTVMYSVWFFGGDIAAGTVLLDSLKTIFPNLIGSIVLTITFWLSRFMSQNLLVKLQGRKVVSLVPGGTVFLILYFVM